MRIKYTTEAAEHIAYWREKDQKVIIKIKALLDNIKDMPFEGIGKPEALRYNLQGYWSRRITKEHRLVYKISGTKEEQVCEVYSCRFHYDR